jgi:hypothetical protein
MEYFSEYEQVKKRPTFLTVLCILTFIGSGYLFLTFLFLSFSTDLIPQMLEVLQNMNYPQESIKLLEQMADVAGWEFLILSFSYALAIIGAAFMLKLNKVGFHLYIVSQLALFCCKNLMIGGDFKMNAFSIIWSILFIVLYGIFYPLMTQKHTPEINSEPDDDDWKSEP